MGRPPKFKTPDELREKIENFFIQCIEKKKVPTKGGLAIALDTTRETLGDYEKKKDYSDALKSAYLFIEENWVQKLAGSNVAGTIFYLKNAFKDNWRDKQEIEIKETLTDKLKKIK